ncbi:hypothetical protein [Rhizorhabdus sp. FW153]
MDSDNTPQAGIVHLRKASLTMQGLPGLYLRFGISNKRPPAGEAD